MKWGNKGENGCKAQDCEKAHPTLCIRSLDLKCTVQDCPAKLHTLKCKRSNNPSGKSLGSKRDHVGPQPGAGVNPGHHGGGEHYQGATGAREYRSGGGSIHHQGPGWIPGYQGDPHRQGGAPGYVGSHLQGAGQLQRGAPHPSQAHVGGNRRFSEFPSYRGVRRESPQQDFHMVTAQQLLGAIQEMVKQVLVQGHALPEQRLGDRHSS